MDFHRFSRAFEFRAMSLREGNENVIRKRRNLFDLIWCSMKLWKQRKATEERKQWNNAKKLLFLNEFTREKVNFQFSHLLSRTADFVAEKKNFYDIKLPKFQFKSFVAFCYSAMNILEEETFSSARSGEGIGKNEGINRMGMGERYHPLYTRTTIHFNWLSI